MSFRSLRFNQDATCFAANSDRTYVSIYNCDPFGKCFELSNNNDIVEHEGNNVDIDGNSNENENSNELMIEMLFSTNLIAVSGCNKNSVDSKKVKIVNTKRKSTICELLFPHAVVDILMNRKRLCVLLESDEIYIYDISCMKHMQTIDVSDEKLRYQQGTNTMNNTNSSNNGDKNTSDDKKARKKKNYKIKMSLSEDDRSILAFTTYNVTDSSSHGIVLNNIIIYDALKIAPINYLNSVHNGNVVTLTISSDGKLLATASEKGTVVRVFDLGVDSQDELISSLLYEFRRGNRQSNIYQLAFNNDSNLIACVGDSDTIHIFKLDSPLKTNASSMMSSTEQATPPADSNAFITADDIKGLRKDLNTKKFKSLLSKTIKKSIPSQSLNRDFAYINLKNPNEKYIVGFPKEFPNELYIIGERGNFNVYSIPTSPAQCVLSKKNSF